jgi:hypothetical protein
MKRIWLIIFALFTPALALGDDQPSVLVTAQEVHQGSLPQIVTAYGLVEPLPDGATNISLLRAGQVEKLSVIVGESGDDYVIDGNIDAKKEIITEGNYELKDGGLVRKGGAKAEP